jgi:hypothetical protein
MMPDEGMRPGYASPEQGKIATAIPIEWVVMGPFGDGRFRKPALSEVEGSCDGEAELCLE